ncbi:MAG: T9SS type A sorting domain-containing protein, partial [Bacteroidota bacterium]
ERAASQNVGQLYYRIKSVDFDGKIQLSSIVELRLGDGPNPISLESYPNPATDILNLEAFAKGGKIQVLDLKGQLRWEEQISDAHGTFNQQLNVSDWSRGIYFVRLSNAYEMKTQKIILK